VSCNSNDFVAWNLPSDVFVTSCNWTFSKIDWICWTVKGTTKLLSEAVDTQTSLCWASWYRNSSSTVCTCSSHEPSTHDCRSCLVAYSVNKHLIFTNHNNSFYWNPSVPTNLYLHSLLAFQGRASYTTGLWLDLLLISFSVCFIFVFYFF